MEQLPPLKLTKYLMHIFHWNKGIEKLLGKNCCKSFNCQIIENKENFVIIVMQSQTQSY